jgi:hypothetical protein
LWHNVFRKEEAFLGYDKFKDEKEAFEFTWNAGNAHVRSSFDENFRDLFPQGHFGSIRDFLPLCKKAIADPILRDRANARWLKGFHPEAFDFLFQYGQDYRPLQWKSWPEFGLGLPEYRACFKNSCRLMCAYNNSKYGDAAAAPPKWVRREDAVYVEGICVGAVSKPMLHAWNAIGIKSRVAFDWTHAAACRWDRYFGFPLTEAEYWELSEAVSGKALRYVNLFDTVRFEKLRTQLVEIAESRIKLERAA